MSSKWSAWDFFRSHANSLPAAEKGIWAFSFFDSFVEEIFKNRLRKAGSKELRLYLGSEITRDWWEGEWKTLDLFGGDSFYLIISAADISKQVQGLILEELDSNSGKEICFCFSGANSFYDALAKRASVSAHKIEAPKFWEWNKYLLFLAEQKNFPLNFESEQYLLDVLNPSGEEFARAIDLMKLSFSTPEKLKREDLMRLFQNEHVDFFKLASLFGSKQFLRFYDELIHFSADEELMRSLCAFMQSHLLKILDPSYAESKNRLSKYDQEIVAHSKRWKARELMQAIRFFATMENKARGKSSLLDQEFKKAYLQTLSPVSL